jgi:hypothetical protein
LCSTITLKQHNPGDPAKKKGRRDSVESSTLVLFLYIDIIDIEINIKNCPLISCDQELQCERKIYSTRFSKGSFPHFDAG